MTSSGPAFFIQERVGFNKRRFRFYKFRTMIKDAEQKQTELEDLNECIGAAFKIKNDPRITQIGRFLRKTSIDELPQLINVLTGDMLWLDFSILIRTIPAVLEGSGAS